MHQLASNSTLAPSGSESRRWGMLFLFAFAAVMAGRLWFLAELPILSRDGAMYCELAQSLGERGAAALREPGFDQHPLFPLAILGVQRGLRTAGLPDAPMVWQRAGQIVAFFAGGVVVLLIAALARTAWRQFRGASGGDAAGVWAVLIAGALPLNVWLAADVMSEPLFLAFYLGAAILLLRPLGAANFGLIGTLSGLAFLVRPEGVGLLIGAIAAAIAGVPACGVRRASAALVVLALGFGVVATPYWATLGGFSPKVNKATVEAFQAVLCDPESEPRAPASGVSGVAGSCGKHPIAVFPPEGRTLVASAFRHWISGPADQLPPLFALRPAGGEQREVGCAFPGVQGLKSPATLERPSGEDRPPNPLATPGVCLPADGEGPSLALWDRTPGAGRDVPIRFARLTTSPAAWYAAPAIAAYETCRAGRVVVPLLALPLIVMLRRRLLSSAWLGVVVAAGVHFGLCTLLRYRHGYLDPRHTLTIVELMIPFSAVALVALETWLRGRGAAWVAPAAGFACCCALALYCLKERDTKSTYLLEVAEYLRRDAASMDGALLTGGSTYRRAAFHAGVRFFKWPEDLPTEEQRVAGLRDVLGGLRPTHLAIETGEGDERRGDARVLAALIENPPAGARLTPVLIGSYAAGKRVTVVRLYRVSYEQP